jgi:hypothetical protein
MDKRVIDALFSRDKGRCKICGTCIDVGPHLITRASIMPNKGEVLENLITLCKDHHKDASYYWLSDCVDGVDGLLPDDLYKLIASSRKKAVKADLKSIFTGIVDKIR